jgi:hypothetical protein
MTFYVGRTHLPQQLRGHVVTADTRRVTQPYSRTLRKGWVMGIIGALYGRGGCGSQRKITGGGRRIPPFKKRRVGHPESVLSSERLALPDIAFGHQPWLPWRVLLTKIVSRCREQARSV